MSSRAFNEAMTQVSNEAEYQQASEKKQRAYQERRAAIFGKVRGVFILLFVATVLVVAFNYRVELQQAISSKPAGESEAVASSNAALQDVHEQARNRDQVLSDISQ